MQKLFRYARVSTEAQNLQSQIDLLLTYGVEKENIYCDVDSGAKTDRKELNFLLKLLRPGDIVVFHDISRIGRDFKHLLDVIDFFHQTGVQFKDLTNPMIDTNSTRTPEGELIFSVFGLMAQFFRKSSNEKVKRGIDSARRQGRVGGRPKGLSDGLKKKAPTVVKLYLETTMSNREICQMVGIAPNSLYKCLKHKGINIKLNTNRKLKNAA